MNNAPSNDRVESVFLSHNTKDKCYVRSLAAAMAVTGTNVWFDEWTIRPGDSVPGSIDRGLAQFTLFALFWSEAASKSEWVHTEMDAAIARWVKDRSLRLVPVMLDRTPLPPLLASLAYIDGSDGDHLRVARRLLGIQTEVAYRLAVQDYIDGAELDFREFWGIGVLVACRRCGATPENIEGWEQVSSRGDQYGGARCKICGWSDGSEI